MIFARNYNANSWLDASKRMMFQKENIEPIMIGNFKKNLRGTVKCVSGTTVHKSWYRYCQLPPEGNKKKRTPRTRSSVFLNSNFRTNVIVHADD